VKVEDGLTFLMIFLTHLGSSIFDPKNPNVGLKMSLKMYL